MVRQPDDNGPLVTVVGLGPAGADLMTAGARAALSRAAAAGEPVFFRTSRHPAATALLAPTEPLAPAAAAETFDAVYDSSETFDEVYEAIVSALLSRALTSRHLVYAVPGSPLVAERTVELLRERAAGEGVALEVQPGLSFADLAWERLAVDPLAAGVRIVDGTCFAEAAAGERGPLLVGQCWSKSVLGDVKLSLEDPAPGQRAILLHHLGLPDEQVLDIPWGELDQAVEADHLTSLYIERLAAPVAGEVVRLVETVGRLRQECPWDREQTHASLVRHLLEEAYETMDALEGLGDDPVAAPPERVAHAEEELGDLLCQVVLHAILGREEGLFDLADISATITDKLVRRHPHVFGDVVASTASDVVTNWERIKAEEKGREHVLDGIPASLPALARAATTERKLASIGLGWEGTPAPGAEDGVAGAGDSDSAGEALLALARAVAAAGGDPEGALRRALDRLAGRVRALEEDAAGAGEIPFARLRPEEVDEIRGLWSRAGGARPAAREAGELT